MTTPSTSHDADIVVVGAGLLGVGMARHLIAAFPDARIVVLEARDAIGGTWDLFRYPGIRSDSDMFSLGYGDKPWRGERAITDGGSILAYIREAADEGGVTERTRLNAAVVAADFRSEDARWHLVVEDAASGERSALTTRFLVSSAGYYAYEEGYTPDFAGAEDFAGRIIHPQHWPVGDDLAGQRVVVIGSGATAMTVVPALARTAAAVTMLQRSPTYVVALPAADPEDDRLRAELPAQEAYEQIRTRRMQEHYASYDFARSQPEAMKQWLRSGLEAALPADFDIDRHFAPAYEPWDQRVCVVPDGDLFDAVSRGDVEVVTAATRRFVPEGVELEDGTVLPADVIVTATGLDLRLLGGMDLAVDGEPVRLRDRVAYRSAMLSGVPNFAFTIGYTNGSWTMLGELIAEFTVRMLRHLEENGLETFTPEWSGEDPATLPALIDNLTSGWVRRGDDRLPRQGHAEPWRIAQHQPTDAEALRTASVTQDMSFTRAAAADDEAA